MFFTSDKQPIKSESKNVNHGGQFYSREGVDKFVYRKNPCLPFARTVSNRKDMLAHVESVLRR